MPRCGAMPDIAATLHEARRDPALAVLEGFHAVKHALRFGAELELVACVTKRDLRQIASALAPDVAEAITDAAVEVGAGTVAGASMSMPAGGVVAIARRPPVDLGTLLHDRDAAPIVLLEDPRRLGNVGACIRVAAAAGAAAVLTTGTSDPWHPDAIRGAAGLHFAIAVARIADINALIGDGPRGLAARGDRPLVALAVDGDPLGNPPTPARAILAFGSERDGLSHGMLAAADRRVCIPMRTGVASLNLATAVAVTLYAG